MATKTKRVRFLKSFSSPTFGNVWPTREVVIPESQADKFIDQGYAEEVDPDKSHATRVKNWGKGASTTGTQKKPASKKIIQKKPAAPDGKSKVITSETASQKADKAEKENK